jgi:hypothetical protein
VNGKAMLSRQCSHRAHHTHHTHHTHHCMLSPHPPYPPLHALSLTLLPPYPPLHALSLTAMLSPYPPLHALSPSTLYTHHLVHQEEVLQGAKPGLQNKNSMNGAGFGEETVVVEGEEGQRLAWRHAFWALRRANGYIYICYATAIYKCYATAIYACLSASPHTHHQCHAPSTLLRHERV